MHPRLDKPHRNLPAHDASIDALSDTRRALLARFWASRAHAELRAADDFENLSQAVARLEAPAPVRQLATRAIADERRHAELCHAVACRYAGHALPFPEQTPAPEAAFEGASPTLTDVLHVVMTCCVIESIAGAYLQTCLQRTEGAVARAALREILADEIDHARIGWALLASDRITPALKHEVAYALRPLLRGCVASWCNNDKPAGEDEAHGFPSRLTVAEVTNTAVRELVVPGFAMLGIDIARAQRFVDSELDALTGCTPL